MAILLNAVTLLGTCTSLIDPAATITGNIITNNNTGYGAYMYYCSPILTNNQITGNGGADIQLHRSTFNASFNVFDVWSGTGTTLIPRGNQFRSLKTGGQ